MSGNPEDRSKSERYVGSLLKPEWQGVLKDLEELTPETLAKRGFPDVATYLLANIIRWACDDPFGLETRTFLHDSPYFTGEDVENMVMGLYDPRDVARKCILDTWRRNGLLNPGDRQQVSLTFVHEGQELPVTSETMQDPDFTLDLLPSVLKLAVPRDTRINMSISPVRWAISNFIKQQGPHSLQEIMGMSDKELSALKRYHRFGKRSLTLLRESEEALRKMGILKPEQSDK